MSIKSQLARFSAVGISVTILDFIILNILRIAGLPFIGSNIVSTTAAMALSYRLNRTHVFKQNTTTKLQKLLFVGGTLFGLYIFQSVIIYGFEINKDAIMAVIAASPFSGELRSELFFTNMAKLVATGFTAVWNFALYKFVVFRKPKRVASGATMHAVSALLLTKYENIHRLQRRERSRASSH